MIEIRDLSKNYNGIKVLDSINLTINNGDIFGLVGASGVGKSTLLNCINGLEEYQEGSILVDGIKVENLNESELREFRRNMGVIFQESSLIRRKNIFQNISLPLECWGYDKSFIKKRVYELAEMVGLEDKLQARPDELSGGQKQRVSIARALALKPKYILSDESTSALDPKTTLSILKLLEKIHKDMGITIIIVTHEMQVVQSICRNMAILENGKVSVSGKVEEMFLNKPIALDRLLGEEEKKLPTDGVNLKLRLVSENIKLPILYELSRLASKKISLVDAKFYDFGLQKNCSMIINFSEIDLEIVKKYLEENKIMFKLTS